jgi:hypothetical protein
VPHGHFRTLCSCGAVIAQCRCNARDKCVTTVEAGCEACLDAVPVYAAERAVAGLAERVLADRTVSLAAPAVPEDDPASAASALAHWRASESGRALATNLEQDDLFYLKSILVSTGLNRNDDYFAAAETWAARATPEDKPFNYEHRQDDIIGHITACRAVGLDGKAVDEGGEPPAAYHLLTTAVVYRRYGDAPERQKRTDTMLEEIAAGKWYVSMECLFKGFDYVLVPEDGSQASGYDLARAKLVARAEETAFLTKHLRAYGGTGSWNGHKVGRVLKNILFSGKGLVRRPANPQSVIFTLDDEPLSGAAAEIRTPPADAGYGTGGAISPPPNEDRMNEIETLKAKLADAEAKLAEALAAIKANDAKASEALKAELSKAKEALDAAEAKAKASAEASAKAAEAAKAAADAKAAAEAELAKLRDERKLERRTASLAAVFGDEAAAVAAGMATMSDEAFDATVKAMAAKVKPGETHVSGLPSPMGGGAKPIGTKPLGGEALPPEVGGAKTATAALDAAQTVPDPALATQAEPAPSEFEQTQADIRAFFGVDEKPSGGEK